MKIASKKQYQEMVKQATPNSPVIKNSIMAFLFGGFVCAFSQLLHYCYVNYLGIDSNDARVFASLSLMLLSGIMTAAGVYDQLAWHAGAGLIVPITGFANSVVSSAIEYKSEGFISGVGSKIFTIAGPVLVFGLSASVLYGMILYIITLFT